MTSPAELLRSRDYVRLLAFAAILGIPIAAVAYFFLELVHLLQTWIFTDLPRAVGYATEPAWWPVPVLGVAGILVGLAIHRLPGRGGHSPADGFTTGTVATARELPGIALAALATLGLGAVLGPEAPLIALGGGLAAATLRLGRRRVPPTATPVVAAAGSFAAISTLLGSPVTGAFLLMEASGLGGAMLGPVLVPGLLSAGVGALIFVGLDAWTGLGTMSLTLPDLPHAASPDVAQFGWAVGIGVAAAFAGTGIRRLARLVRPHVDRRVLLVTPMVGLVVGALAVLYTVVTGKGSADVLFSGQSGLGPLIDSSAGYGVGVLLLLIACKGLAYAASMSAFRGGPVFPAMYLGAAGGLLLSHLPGLPPVTAAAMGIGAMCTAMLNLPFTSVLLATLLLGKDGITLMPLVIVAVVVAYVVSARIAPAPTPGRSAEPAPAVAVPAGRR
ncbi:MAG TPA: chloride channel protein [Micromonosporaceae bacterium]